MDPKILRDAALAYEAVYNQEMRQEVEEQKDFENWVNSLVEEGYDLSEYTWEEMYETYITEIGVNFGGQAAVDKVRARAASERASAAKLDAARAQRFGRGGAPSAGKDSSGNLRKPAPSAARPAATTPASRPSSAPAARPVGTTPAARPSGGSSAPAARPAASAPTAKPTPTAAAKPAAAAPTAAAKPKTPNPLMQKTFGYQTGGAPDQVAKTAAPTPAAKPTPTPTKRPGGSVKPGSLVSGFDMFDVVKGYLIDEGYAETEQAAIAIMANMSEGWKSEIIDEAVKGESSERRRALAAERRKGIKPLSAKEGEKYATHKIAQMAYTKRAKMGDDD